MTDGAGSMMEAPPPAPRPNPFSRLVGVLFSPDQTLSSVARQPDITLPLVLLIVVGLFAGFARAQKVDFVAGAREQMAARGGLSSEQIDQQLKITAAVLRGVSYCSPIVGLIAITIFAAILMLAYRLMGGEGGFFQYFSITLYAWVPQLIKELISAVVLLSKAQPVRAELLETVVRSNPGFLVDFQAHPVLFSLLSSLDVFSIWWGVLTIIGLAYVAKVSKAKSTGIFLAVWIFFTGLKLGAAAVGSMMRPAK